ncbi:MAG: hypothetical protein ACI9CD_001052 [Candidatus Deianiraeaceae bacterium]|jgi:hypothetical protein
MKTNTKEVLTIEVSKEIMGIVKVLINTGDSNPKNLQTIEAIKPGSRKKMLVASVLKSLPSNIIIFI